MIKKRKRQEITEEPYALVDMIFDNNWKPVFRWALSTSRKSQGSFSTVDEAIFAVPQNIRKIIVDYKYDDKEVYKEINRTNPVGRILEKSKLTQLQKGILVEKEHADVYHAIKTGTIRSAADLYVMIAKAHLREDPRYYSKLAVLEKPPVRVEGCKNTGKYILIES